MVVDPWLLFYEIMGCSYEVLYLQHINVGIFVSRKHEVYITIEVF